MGIGLLLVVLALLAVYTIEKVCETYIKIKTSTNIAGVLLIGTDEDGEQYMFLELDNDFILPKKGDVVTFIVDELPAAQEKQ